MSVARSSQPPTSDGRTTQSHCADSYPAGFRILCFVVFCERCAAIMLASSLVLMLCVRYGHPRVDAIRLAGLITAAGYLGSLPGGFLADRVLGHRRGLFVSLLFLTVAYLLFTLRSSTALWPSLTVLMVGNSLFKPSAQAVLGRLFSTCDPLFGQAQLWLHFVINVAAVLGAFLAGILTPQKHWSLAFFVAALVVTLGWFALQFLPQSRAIGHATYPSKQTPSSTDSQSGQRLKTIATLTLAMMLFNVCYGQVEGALLLWIQQHVERTLHGFTVPLSWFVGLPSLLVLFLSPVQLALLPFLQRCLQLHRLIEIGLIATSLAFAVLLPADLRSHTRPVGIGWVIVCQLLLVVGETLVVPLGMAQVIQLAPPKLLGVVMGVWFVSGSAGFWLAGEIGALWFSLSPTSALTLLILLPLFGTYVVHRVHRPSKDARRDEPLAEFL